MRRMEMATKFSMIKKKIQLNYQRKRIEILTVTIKNYHQMMSKMKKVMKKRK